MENLNSPGEFGKQMGYKQPRSKKILAYLDSKINYILVAPMVIILVSLIIYPMFFNINLSIRSVTIFNFLAGEWEFIGIENYLKIINDPFVQKAFIRTLSFAFFTVVAQLILGMIAALAFNENFKGKGFLMPLALAPMMITPVAVGLFWRILLNSRWGIINYFLSLIGIEPQLWLADPTLAFISIVIVQVWWGVSFVFLIILGGLSSLPTEPYEAAVIDGASKWQTFRFLTLPLLRPVLTVIAVIRIIDALREFDIVYTLTGGGPGNSTRVFTLELFKSAFEEGLFGIGAAQSIILLVIIMIFTSGLIRALSNTGQAKI